MPKVMVQIPDTVNYIPADCVPLNAICREEKSGDIYIRTCYSMFCINSPGHSWSNHIPTDHNFYVYPKGTVLTVTQE